ncbi:unnamed protein product [Schistosoma curassoni]|uniref:Uncharacterized protein n=1 Tax=Schistosoma curassoni TaxID=6186 RepID=A0A183JU66_9TREM|nr:unnamed protein product [Schistosoma curassoni]
MDTSDESQNIGRNSILPGDKNKKNSSIFGPTESSVRIVLSGNSRIGNTDSQVNIFSNASDFHSNHTPEDAITQTLAPGRVPSGFGSNLSNYVTASVSHNRLADTTTSETNLMTNTTGGTNAASSNDIMQLLLVHERRGLLTRNSAKNVSVPGQFNILNTVNILFLTSVFINITVFSA